MSRAAADAHALSLQLRGLHVVRAIEARTPGKTTLPWLIGHGGALRAAGADPRADDLDLCRCCSFRALLLPPARPRCRDHARRLRAVLWAVAGSQLPGLRQSARRRLVFRAVSRSAARRANYALDGSCRSRAFLRRSSGKTSGADLFQFGEHLSTSSEVLVAPVFFVALLHLFKRPETATFRWCILSCGFSASSGWRSSAWTAIHGGPLQLQANDLHVLFIPLMTFYGLAFVLVMWTRLEINIRLVRLGFSRCSSSCPALPFIKQFIDLQQPADGRVQWPPYVPPSSPSSANGRGRTKSSSRTCRGRWRGMPTARACGCR